MDEQAYLDEVLRLDQAVRSQRPKFIGGICRYCQQLVAHECDAANARGCPNRLSPHSASTNEAKE